MKMALYAIICVAFLAAGAMDLAAGERKLGVVSLLFALVTGVIFFWR